MKNLLSSILVLLIATSTTHATGTSKKKSKCHFKVLTAYTKTISENEQSNPPMEGHFFVIKWETKLLPETFFWRGEGGWLTCDISKAHKNKAVYTSTPANINQIHQGDTLMLTPLTGGRFPVPDDIPATAKNTIFYKVNGGKWLACPVKTITKK